MSDLYSEEGASEIASAFNPAEVGDRLAALEDQVRNGLRVAQDRSAKAAALLWDVQQHHPEHLEAVCTRANIARSRRDELLRIGRGDKTIEAAREQNAAR